MCINLRLFHQILKSLFLKHSLFFFLQSFLQLLIQLLSLPLAISNFLVSTPPELSHFLSESSSSHDRLLCQSLSLDSLLPHFFKAILGHLLVVALLVSFEFLVHSESFRNIFLHYVLPSSLYVLTLLFALSFLRRILNLVS